MDSLIAETIIDNSTDGFMITDADHRIVGVNRSFCATTGYSSDEVIGKTPKILSSGNHDQSFYDALWQSVSELGFWNGEIWNRKKSGELYLQRISISTIRDHQGKVLWYIANFTRIDREAQREEEMARILEGINRGEFLLYYQPQVDIVRERVIGMEALIRWNHPEKGLLSPASFMPLIEKTHLSVPVGKFVMHSAFSQTRLWVAQGLNFKVCINISPRHLTDSHFILDLQSCLREFPDVPPELIELEVVESASLGDLGTVIPVMEEAINLGVQFSLDDFGTGHSSLNYLRQLPARTIKIDQGFVRTMHENMKDLLLVEAITSLAHTFDRTVIAEGVELIETAIILAQIGSPHMQGYAISRPMPPDDVLSWIQNWSPHPLWKKEKLRKWDREDLPLLYVQIDHRRWVEEVRQVVYGSGDTPFDLDLDAKECRFGKWYYQAGRSRYSELPQYAEIEELHDRLHRSLGRVSRRISQGNHTFAKIEFQRLLGISELLNEKLSVLANEVTLARTS
jgi:PAS domain S-box-containing protein